MFIFLIVLILVVAILMSIVVLLQSGKGGGLAGIASGGQTTQILGARQAPDFLEKSTWTLGGVFLFLCLITTFFIPGERQGSILQDRADEIPVESGAPIGTPDATPIAPAPPADAPAGDAAPADAGGDTEGGE